MIGGLMKTTSRFALVAAAVGFLMGGYSLSARAADLGGDCCADLEERVAELESTTVRKGNRKVSLELSGQVDKALLIWNDGKNSDAFVVDNGYSSSRFRMKGTGQMMPGWKAGFYIELEGRDSASSGVNQLSETGGRGTDSLTGSLRWRQENVFVESEKFGRVTIGVQNMATKDLTLINLGGGMVQPENDWAAGFRLRNAAGAVGASTVTWNQMSNALDAVRAEVVRYDSPSLYGFIFSASWGQNDVWDTALRYQKEWNSIRIAGGIGYSFFGEANCAGATNNTALNGTCTIGGENADQVRNNAGFPTPGIGTKTEIVSGDVSVMHVPTGLYATFAAATRHLTNPAFTAVANKDATYWYGQAGITKRFWEVGATTLYVDGGVYDNFGVGVNFASLGGGVASSTSVDRWGAGITQAFDGAALELYSNYIHYSADVTTNSRQTPKPVIEDWDAVITGARLKF